MNLAEAAALIDREPDRADHYLALADLLQDDPRAELIRLQHARPDDGEVSAREAELTRQLTPQFPDWRQSNIDLSWWHGFVQSLGFSFDEHDDRNPDFVAEVLDHASLRHLRNLDLSTTVGEDLDEDEISDYLVTTVAARPRPALRHFYLQQTTEDGAGCSRIDLSPLWAAAPNITEMSLDARSVALAVPAQTALETLLTWSCAVKGEELAQLLERSPRLKVLHVKNLVKAEPFWKRLAQLTALAQAQSVWLLGVPLDDAAAAQILEAAPLLAHLAELKLPAASEAQQTAIHSRLPKALFSKPAEPEPDDEE